MTIFNLRKICYLIFLCNIDICVTYFEGCNYSQYISEPNRLYYVFSPYYPNNYPSRTSCLYEITVPQDYEIVADCTLSIPKSGNTCTDYFLISREGDPQLNGAEQICGTGNLTRISSFNKIILAYISEAGSPGGRFSCKLTTRRQACDCGWFSQSKIVGGKKASQYEFPSVVSLRLAKTGEHFCAGTIINHRYIITAAHCTLFAARPKNIKIHSGYYELNGTSQFTRIYEAQEIINYPEYNPSINDENDIALIKTTVAMEWSRYIGPMCLPFDQVRNSIKDFTSVEIIGWGTLSFSGNISKTLQSASVYVVPNSNCHLEQPSELCTYFPGRDSCQKDSGGPVVLKGNLREYLVGIISRGTVCLGPAINTRASSYLDWIYHITNGTLCYKPYN